MHLRRLLCALIGFWFTAGVVIGFSLFVNSWIVDAVIGTAEQPVLKAVKSVGYAPIRQLMSSVAHESDRFLIISWGWMEILLILLVIGMLVPVKAGPASFGAAGLALVMAIAIRFLIAPDVIGFGRMLDFVPDSTMLAERGRFASMQRAYFMAQGVELLLSFGLLVAFLRRTRSRRLPQPLKPINQVNGVDDADDAHVDG